MRNTLRFASLVAISAAIFIVPGSAQKASSAPKARYAMDVGTTTGMAAMGSGMGAGMSMIFGGGSSKEARELRLRIGSTLTPASGAPTADHFFLPPAKLGKSVPLLAPEKAEGSYPTDFQRPKGRILLFWGCGAHAAKGQPVIIDFSKIAAGQMPAGLFTTRVPYDHGPSSTNSRTFAEWPNKKSGKQPGKDSSLLGEHRIAANFSPEIKFALSQDYMPGVNVSSADQTDGSVLLNWNSVAPATGYVAWTMGGKMGADQSGPQDMVWWTSASAREFGGGLWDWLPPETVRQLVRQKIVMPPSQTSCAIPAEVKAAAPDFMMGFLNAFGPEASFSYPPRPADPKAAWTLDWTARVRYRSHTSWMVGGPMMGGGMPSGGTSEPRPKKKCKGPMGIPIPGTAC
jgi:hypothetical protein